MPRKRIGLYHNDQVPYGNISVVLPRPAIDRMRELAIELGTLRCLQPRPAGTKADYIQLRLVFDPATLSYRLHSPVRRPRALAPDRYEILYQVPQHQWCLHTWPARTAYQKASPVGITWLNRVVSVGLLPDPFETVLEPGDLFAWFSRSYPDHRLSVRRSTPQPRKIVLINQLREDLQLLRDPIVA